jgi:ferredoxin-NADP reductase
VATPSEAPALDLASYELTLRRAATVRAGEAADPELARILDRVRTRRAERSGRGGSPMARAVPGTEPASPPDAPGTVSGGPPGQVLAIEQVGPAVRILRVGRPPGLQFKAGQYLRAGIAGRRAKKFSLASAPHEPVVELCIELIPGGELTPLLFTIQVGAQLELSDTAKGSFLLDEQATRHVFVATVTGIAPLRSMLRDALHRGVGQEFVILHGASNAEDLPYRAELEALAAADPRVRYVPTVSQPQAAINQGWSGHTGRVDPLAVEVAATIPTAGTRVYACGNPGMVANVVRDLEAAGFTVSSEEFS